MNTEFFPHFMRSNFPAFEITNEDAIEIGESFKFYMTEKFKDEPDKLNTIWNIDPMNVIPNLGHPFKTNGYDSVLVLHFTLFIEESI